MHLQKNGVKIHHKNTPDIFRTRFSVPFRPKARREFLEDNYWTIFGSGSLGSKVEELRNKAAAIEQAGFTLYPRAVLAMGFFDSFRIRCRVDETVRRGAGSEELQKLVLGGDFNEREMETLECISRYWLQTPLVIRSSAHGDSRGTGIYKSVLLFNGKDDERNLAGVVKAVKSVLASEFSEDAVAYRKDLSLAGGIAVMIEPVFGNEFVHTQEYTNEKERRFGSAYGGIAYTGSKLDRAKAFVAAGLPFEAVNGKSIEIDADTEHSIYSLKEYLLDHIGFERTKENSKKLEILSEGECIILDYSSLDGEAYSSRIKINKMRLEMLPFEKWLFPKLNALGELLGKQHYVEFAVTDNYWEPKVAILQIAEVTQKTDFYQISENERTLVKTTQEVVGTGQRLCGEIIEIWNPDDIPKARKYNKNNSDYAVLYGGRLVSSPVKHEGYGISYSDVNRASVFIELSELDHTQNIRSHWGGALDSANKLLFAAEKIEWDKLDTYRTKNNDGLVIFKVPVRITASERQQKAVVEIDNG